MPDPADREARDPATTAERLQALAYEFPHTHPLIAMHPNAYPGLLQWIADYGASVTPGPTAIPVNDPVVAGATVRSDAVPAAGPEVMWTAGPPQDGACAAPPTTPGASGEDQSTTRSRASTILMIVAIVAFVAFLVWTRVVGFYPSRDLPALGGLIVVAFVAMFISKRLDD